MLQRIASAFKNKIVKPIGIRIAGARAVQSLGHRAVYLHRFHKWCRENPCPSFPGRQEVYDHVFRTEGLDGPIDYLEFGVYRGASISWWVDRNRHPGTRFAGFDSFEGLPEDWGNNYLPKGHFTTHGEPPKIPDNRCSFVKGWFQNTLGEFLKTNELARRKVLHLDADLYSSTLYVLAMFAERLRPGDVLIFDEFHDYMDEFRALQDIQSAFPLKVAALARTEQYAQVAVRVV